MTIDRISSWLYLVRGDPSTRPNNLTERHPSLAYICGRIASVADANSQIHCEEARHE